MLNGSVDFGRLEKIVLECFLFGLVRLDVIINLIKIKIPLARLPNDGVGRVFVD